jgi:lipid II:glycine glycyltransferase (peptidoglycan interpeptide bridge formation enzyme)
MKKHTSHIFIAYHGSIPLAAYEIFIWDKIAHFPFGATDITYKKLMGSNLLMWEVIRYAKKMRCKYFDMSETLGPKHNALHPWAGLTKFAEGYGGRYIKFVKNYDYIVYPKQYVYYRDLEFNIENIISRAFSIQI